MLYLSTGEGLSNTFRKDFSADEKKIGNTISALLKMLSKFDSFIVFWCFYLTVSAFYEEVVRLRLIRLGNFLEPHRRCEI